IHFDYHGKLKFRGITRLFNDENGQYTASLFGKPFEGLESDIMRFLQLGGNKGFISYYQQLMPDLEAKLKSSQYTGPLGIDAFIYRTADGELRMRPTVEINFRYTMGRLALSLEKRLKKGMSGLFKIYSLLSSRDRIKYNSLKHHEQSVIPSNEQGLWTGGVCQLNEWSDDLKFPAYISIGRNINECLQQLE
ncbi:MAG: hypothetical protein HRT88_23795, partial [Lentisphaeraceae bacterium]|nr:hypothetical protein [Lentisphaeraceae bacterium]